MQMRIDIIFYRRQKNTLVLSPRVIVLKNLQLLFDELGAADLVRVAVYVEGRGVEFLESNRGGSCPDFESNLILGRGELGAPIAGDLE